MHRGLAALPGVEERVRRLVAAYRSHYRADPSVVSRAPGRAELIGNHTDHNGGEVVAAAVELDTVVVAGPSEDRSTSHAFVPDWERDFRVDHSADRAEERHDTERLMRGVAAGLTEAGVAAPPYRAIVDSTVLPGSGLSSSAAFEVALAGVHAALAGESIDPMTAALAGQHAENDYMGKPSGLMDQLASATGGLVHIDFSNRAVATRVRSEQFVQSYRLLVIDSQASHADLTANYAQIPQDMRRVADALGVGRLSELELTTFAQAQPALIGSVPERALLRALHFFDENDRVRRFVAAAQHDDTPQLLQLLQASGDSSWRLLQNVHTEADEQKLALTIELAQRFFSAAQAQGAARVHGGGFAGTALAAVHADDVSAFRTWMQSWIGPDSVTELHISPHGLVYESL